MKKEKASKIDVEDRLNEILIEDIGEEYRIKWASDNSGPHVCVMFENEFPENSRKYLPTPFMGWRLIIMKVPQGYLDIFYPIKIM